MKPMYVIGIDNGVTGSIAFMKDGKLVDSMPMPTMKTQEGNRSVTRINHEKLRYLVEDCEPLHTLTFIERPVMMPQRAYKKGRQPSLFAMLSGQRAYEATLVVLESAGLGNIIRVDSKSWQSRLLPGVKGRTLLKERAAQFARDRVAKDWGPIVGQEDAICIAYWGYNYYERP